MGMLEETIKDIRRDIKAFRAGKLSPDEVGALMKLYTTSLKASGQIINAFAVAAKHKRWENKMLDSGLFGNGTVIDMSTEEIEAEKILCPLNDQLITRSECVDFSGEEKNYEKCKGCEVGAANKKLVVGPALHTA